MFPRWMIPHGAGGTSTCPIFPVSGADKTKGLSAMNEKLYQVEEEVLSYEVSDEALETAGSVASENAYTLGACSGLSVCPG
jgi:hypothetical protein